MKIYPCIAAMLLSAVVCCGSPGDLDPQAIRFERLEKTELPELKRKLEEAGWPAPHVQALLNAEIQRRFNPPFRARPEDLRAFEFWRTGPDALPFTHLNTPERRAEQAQREELARAKFDALFPPADEESELLGQWEQRRQWGDLSPEKRAKVQEILAARDQANDHFVEERGRMLTKEEWATIWSSNRAARAKLEELLTAEELLDYDLRNSNTAEQMRNELDSFAPTRDEFVAIFRLRHPLELEFHDKVIGIDAALDARRAAAEKACEQKIAELLGPARYSDYQISLQPACQTLRFDGRYARVDAATIRSLYRDFLAAKQQIADAQRAPTDQKATDEKIARIKAELFARFRAVLDEEGTRRYLQEQELWP